MPPSRQTFASDYIDVNTRIVEFRTRFPEGSLQQVSLDFRDFGGMSWVIYTAAAYRTPDDTRPGHGTAWEPVPGLTPFTKGSEVQNAETAAWGRAIVAALAGDTKKGIASAEEVRGAQERREPMPDAVTPNSLRAEIALAARAAGLSVDDVEAEWAETHGGEFIGQSTDLGSLELVRDDLRERAK